MGYSLSKIKTSKWKPKVTKLEHWVIYQVVQDLSKSQPSLLSFKCALFWPEGIYKDAFDGFVIL